MNHLPNCFFSIQGHIECQAGCSHRKATPGGLDYQNEVRPIKPFDMVNNGPPSRTQSSSESAQSAPVNKIFMYNQDGSFVGMFTEAKSAQLINRGDSP
jgi:hypothetical protein